MTEDFKQVTFGGKESEEQVIASVEMEENQESEIAKKYIMDLLSKSGHVGVGAGLGGENKEERNPEELPFMSLAGDQNLEQFDRKNSLLNFGSSPPKRKLQRSESLFDPPQISELVVLKNQQDFKPDSSVFLKERGILKYKLQSGQIQEAR